MLHCTKTWSPFNKTNIFILNLHQYLDTEPQKSSFFLVVPSLTKNSNKCQNHIQRPPKSSAGGQKAGTTLPISPRTSQTSSLCSITPPPPPPPAVPPSSVTHFPLSSPLWILPPFGRSVFQKNRFSFGEVRRDWTGSFSGTGLEWNPDTSGAESPAEVSLAPRAQLRASDGSKVDPKDPQRFRSQLFHRTCGSTRVLHWVRSVKHRRHCVWFLISGKFWLFFLLKNPFWLHSEKTSVTVMVLLRHLWL